jgi:hypothetical protein
VQCSGRLKARGVVETAGRAIVWQEKRLTAWRPRRLAARVIPAEIGPDRSRVGADTCLASWAVMGPGHDERAGKRRRGRARQGRRSLKWDIRSS